MRFLGLASLVLATVLGASNASAGFILIDDFNPGPDLAGAGRTITGFPTATAGGDILNAANTNYFNVNVAYNLATAFDIRTAGSSLMLGGLNVTQGTVVVSATLNGQSGITASQTISSGFNGDVFFRFNNLPGNDGQLLSKVTSIALNFAVVDENNPVAFRFTLDQLSAVPEPTTLALIGLTAAGGGVAGWRKRRARRNS